MSSRIVNYRRDLGIPHDDILMLADSCLELGDLVIANVEHRKFSKPIHCILAANHYKATDSLISAVKLVESGLVGDAETIVRKLAEIAINMKFLCMDADRRQWQYWHYLKYSKKKMADAIVEDQRYNERLRQEAARFQPVLDRQFQEVEHLIAKTKKGRISTDSWSGLNVKAMAEQCGLENDYLYCYRLFCIPTHAGVHDIERFVDVETAELNPRYNTDTALATIIEASRLYLIIVELVIGHFGLQLMESHRLIGERLESFKGDQRLPNWQTPAP